MTKHFNSDVSAGAPDDKNSPQDLWNERYATLPVHARLEPTPFVASCLSQIPVRGLALDVAAGAGRHSLALARLGWQVDAVDISGQGAWLARQRAVAAGLGAKINFILADIERPWLPHRGYDLILVSYFLHRPLFPLLKAQLGPGGWLIYETFTIDRLDQVRQKPPAHQRPPRREFLLEHHELFDAFADLKILFYEEGSHEGRATAQLLARKPA